MTPQLWIQLSIQLVDDFLDGNGRLQRSQRETFYFAKVKTDCMRIYSVEPEEGSRCVSIGQWVKAQTTCLFLRLLI